MSTSHFRAFALFAAFCCALLVGPGDAQATRIDRLVDRDSGLIGGGLLDGSGGTNSGILITSAASSSSSSTSSGSSSAVTHGSESETGENDAPRTQGGEIPVPEPSAAMVFALGLLVLGITFRDRFET